MIRKEIDQYKEQLDKNPRAYQSFPEEAKDEKEITNYALTKDPFNMWYMNDRLKNDKDYAIHTLSTYPTFHLNKLGPKLQKDREVVLFAMKQNRTFGLRDLGHVCKYFIDDKEVMDKAMEKLRENPLIVPGEVKLGEAMVANFMGREKAIEEIQKDPEIYRLLSAELKQDPKVAMAAIQQENYLINEIPKELQNTNFYTAAVMSIRGVEQELPLRVRAEVKQQVERLSKPCDLREALRRAKEQCTSKETHTEKSGREFDRCDR